MKQHALLVIATLGLTTPAMAINKCTDASGSVTFSDMPCPNTQKATAIKVRPSGGQAAVDTAPKTAPAPAAAPAAPSPAAASKPAAPAPAGAANTAAPATPPAKGAGAAPAETPPPPPPPKPKNAYERMLDEAQAAEATKQKRILRERIEQLDRDYDRMGDRMHKEIDALRNKKPDTNVANGATWEQSITAEMQAVTVNYDNRMKSNRAEVDRLREEMNSLK
ncbi:DUF4124 domain-containing protein [Chitinimonas naiadis]